MTGQFPEAFFKDAVDFLFTETFTVVRGAYLDRGTSLFETLATIDAAEASKPLSPCCGSIAAQVYHTRFYIDVSEQYMNGTPPENVDWDGSWTAVTTVNDEEWQALIGDLRASIERVKATVDDYDSWAVPDRVNGALTILMHSAFHLGQIRQSLCTIKTCLP
jgi:hypothetical protein